MENKDGQFRPTKETFDYNIDKFKRKGKKNYFFITRAGNKFKDIVYKLCLRMYYEEEFPKSFQETTLHMLWKRKGRADILSDNRFLHCKEWFPRVA